MTYTVEAAFSPAQELILSLDVFLCKKMHKRVDLGTHWVQETKSRLTPDFLEEVSDLDTFENWQLLSLLAWCSPEHTAEGYLRWLDGLSPGDMYEKLSPWMSYFPKELGDMRAKAVSLMTEWNRQYFVHMDKAVLETLEDEAKEIRERIPDEEPVPFIEKVTGGLYFEQLETDTKVVLIPQVHAQPTAIVSAFEGLTICRYASGRRNPAEAGDEPGAVMTRMLRGLSDRTRLKIMHFLKSGPKPYIEIFQHMGMSKSTVYEHMLQLRGAGLVRGHLIGENTVAYSIREDAIDILKDELIHYLR